MTSTIMMTTLDVISPTDPRSTLSPSELITQNETSISPSQNHDTNGNMEPSNSSQAVVPCTNGNIKDRGLNNSYYEQGINAVYEMFFSCFRPKFWGGNQRTKQSAFAPQNQWEISIDSIKELEYFDCGSHAAVFKAKYNGKQVAVKKVKKAGEVVCVKNLLHLKHENIVEFIGLCSQTPCYFIVMEFCEKGSLSHILKSENIISRDDWIRWLKEIAQGMLYLHDNKVIHRDLKSANLLVSNTNTIKICDFGTSQVREEMNSMKMSFCGTISWMAPEVVKNQKCSEKVDVYSFGVVLWEMLTREEPYKNIETATIMYNIGKKKLSLPIPSLASDGSKTLLKQTLCVNPQNRLSFRSILFNISIIERELKKFTDETWPKHHSAMRQEAESYKYPVELSSESESVKKNQELERRRYRVLKDAEDIRRMYNMKFVRVTEMMSTLSEYFKHLEHKEKELIKREMNLLNLEAFERNSRHGSKSLIARAGPQTIRGERQDISTTVFSTTGSGHNGYDSSSSVWDLDHSSDNFSRESSYRCSASRCKEIFASYNQTNRDARAHSENLNHDNLVRGCPARNSGCSEDSGVNLHCSISNMNLSNQSSPHPMARHYEGRSSDSRRPARLRRGKAFPFEKVRRSESSNHKSKERSPKYSSNRNIRVTEQAASTSSADVGPVSDDYNRNKETYNHINDLKTDASSENSDDDYVSTNGNNAKKIPKLVPRTSKPNIASSNDEPDDDENYELNNLTNSNTSAMASSLERALATSDGLSDKEKTVRAASATIKGHRRCYSHPLNNFFYPNAEISEDSDQEVDV